MDEQQKKEQKKDLYKAVKETVPGSEEEQEIRDKMRDLNITTDLQRTPRILIVEDEEDWRRKIAYPLEKKYKLDFAKTNDQAQEKLRKDHFDLICMNIHLDKIKKESLLMDWTNLLGEAEENKIPVIVITSPELFEKDLYEVANNYNVKKTFFKTNIQRKQLLDIINQCLSI